MTREEREEVIAILESYKSTEDQRTEYLLHHGYDNTKEAIKRKEALDEAIKALSVPEREKGEWIPVSERLPEDRGNYIIDYTNEFGEFVDISYFDKYGFWSSSNVIAWQPLPEPYKAESEE